VSIKPKADRGSARKTADLPEGFSYFPDFLLAEEERELMSTIERLEFEPFRFQGYTAKREVVVYGWDYDFSSRRASEIHGLPEFLLPLRTKVAARVEVAAEAFVEALVTKYPPGAPIGWHRDVPQFEIVAGISLGSSCRMRFKPYKAEGRAKIASITLDPRSLYVMQGPARWEFQHSIREVEQLRYSVTLRTLRKKVESNLE
jgi:alkylated DNA repair dioxygenase AlkB